MVNSSALTFTSGQSSSNMPTQCIDLDILNDDILEYNENFIIQLVNRTNKVEITATGEQSEVVIQEDNADCKLITVVCIVILARNYVCNVYISHTSTTNIHYRIALMHH